MRRWLQIFITISTFFIVLMIIVLLATMHTHTPSLPGKDSVAEQRYLTLGGVKQWVLIRGTDRHNPILLFLHGGPGMPVGWLFRSFNSELEHHFITVNWDQRGAGKSYHWSIPPTSMTVEQFLADLHELITYLKQRFAQNKIYLAGASWGSFLGILYAQKHPENIEAYISIGQATHQKEAERLGYTYALEQAQEKGDHKAVVQLLKIQEPIGKSSKDASTIHNWLLRFGGSLYNKISFFPWVIKMLSVDEYAWPDLIRLWLGIRFTQKLLWPQVFDTNFFEKVPALKVPVYFLLGVNDYIISTKLAKKYFHHLIAPKKELILFNYSGHNPMFEQPQQFNKVLRAIRYGHPIKTIKEKELAFLQIPINTQYGQVWALRENEKVCPKGLLCSS